MSPPILGMPREPPDTPDGLEGTFILDTDASDLSIGCVLSQIQDGQERVIAYGARTLQPAQRNYCITRRELLAVIVFAKAMRSYLLGRHWILRTDHSALTWLRRTTEPIGQNARWLEQLEEYDYEVVHHPGNRHGNADALSRHPCPVRTPCTACKPHETVDWCQTVHLANKVNTAGDEGLAGLWTRESLADAQRDDPEVGPVYQVMIAGDPQPAPSEINLWSRESKMLWRQWPRLNIKDGVMYRRWEEPDGLQWSWQVVVPQEISRGGVSKDACGHDGGTFGSR